MLLEFRNADKNIKKTLKVEGRRPDDDANSKIPFAFLS
jgi:hypothetical protein